MTKLSAQDVIYTLGLQRHPEGGWYARTFEDEQVSDSRAQSTAIYYLLQAGETSQWHRVDAVEVWHWYAGAPLDLSFSDGKSVNVHRLGKDIELGERPQVVAPRLIWQSAVSLGEWTLVGCTVSPGFEFAGFELAPKGWEPGQD
ncbi:cupin [Devosia epidermidihirudinis]|uniref:Cupin n=1 Tax=Devosia epidermidihirudinis TaxID=1293439 RepID=A0A0F5QG16_9HYPH|nr:cupin domain-containing protein [Devosia epidermidihirudinis]KKC39676.1 cupin [Devosia epidermidihirudinis]